MNIQHVYAKELNKLVKFIEIRTFNSQSTFFR